MNPPNGATPDQPQDQPEPKSIGQHLGLGRHWTPAPAAWAVTAFRQPTGPLFVLVFETVTGRVGIALNQIDVTRLRDQLTQASSGFVLPSAKP